MTNEQTDAALEAMLTDLEQARPDTLRERMPAMLALLVLIGRKLLPARTSASDETMPGRGAAARAGAERRAAAPPTYDQYLESLERAGFYVDAREERVQRAYARRMSAGARPDADLRTDPPRPTVRDRVAGATFAEFERTLADKDRSELAETLTRLEAAQQTIANRERTIAEIRANLDRAHDDIGRLERERSDAWARANACERSHAGLRSSLQAALGLPANALDAVIIAKVRETGDVLKVAHGQIEEARKVLAAMCDIGVEHDPPLTLPALAERAARRIAVLLEEHQRERTAVDELQGRVAEQATAIEHLGEQLRVADADRIPLRMDLDIANARWARIQPLIMALHAVENWPRFVSAIERAKLSRFVDRIEWWDGATAPDGRDVLAAVDRVTDNSVGARAVEALLRAFEAWQKAEAAALDADEPVDVPRQPDDPGVESDLEEASAVLDERRAIVEYMRGFSESYAPGSVSDVVRNLADGIARGAHVGSDRRPGIASTPQPLPTGDGEPVLETALALNGLTPRIKRDLSARAGDGLRKYGTFLRVHNGRNALVDAYQEALDAIMYTTQDLLEHKSTGLTQKAVALALRIAEVLEERGL